MKMLAYFETICMPIAVPLIHRHMLLSKIEVIDEYKVTTPNVAACQI